VRLARLARTEWVALSTATACLMLGSATGLVYPKVLGFLIDGAAPRFADRMTPLVLGVVAVLVVHAFAVAARAYLFATAGERIVARLRRELFEALVHQEVAFFDAHRTGELTSRLSSDTAVLQNTLTSNLSLGLRSFATAAGGTFLLLALSPRLALLMLALAPPIAIGAAVAGRSVQRLSREVQDELAHSSEIAEESLAGIRTVRAFNAEAYESRRYTSSLARVFALAKARAKTTACFMGIATLTTYGFGTVLIGYAAELVARGTLLVGELASFLIYTVMVGMSFGSLAEVWTELMRASGSIHRVFELLDRARKASSKPGLAPSSAEGSLEFRALCFAYPMRPERPVLEHIDLSLRAGEVVALVGSSGAGKSTLAAMLLRMYEPTAGTILLDGLPLCELDPSWLRAQVGLVSQEPVLFAGTIADNIRYARPSASDAEVEAAARAAHVHEFIAALPDGYRTRVGERGTQLSGGQKQRVAIARAVLKAPRILILDEATSALDAENEHEVQLALQRLMRGRTTLVIAHRLSTVMNAQRVVVLERGAVVQLGDHASLMREHGLYRRLIERQFNVA
jgi:ABC-type multidrug transport system fused ATPase/permease subunit